jgi:TBC1 domain family protein 5
MSIQQYMFSTETDTSLKGVINPNSKNNTPILQRIITLIDQKLKALDLDLFRTIKLQDVQTKAFLLRWIRCMHTREFSLESSFDIWDSIFLDYNECPASREKNQFEFIDAMCVAMFIYIRHLALSRESAYEITQVYQKYPKLEKGKCLAELISRAWTLSEELRQPPGNEDSKAKTQKKD